MTLFCAVPPLFPMALSRCFVALAWGLAAAWPVLAELSPTAQTTPPLNRQSRPARTALPAQVLETLRQAHVPASALSVRITPLPDNTSAAAGAFPGSARAKPGNRPRHLSHQAHANVNPASVMKLFTTYAGLSLLGPDHVWRNRIYTDGTLHGGVLQGDLIVRGSGDPKLVVERLRDLLTHVQAVGVREVRGDIVLDRSVFDVREPTEPFDDEPLRPYNVTPDGLLLNFKTVVYTFTPDSASGLAHVRFEPPLAGLTIPAPLPLTSAPCNDWRRQLQADFSQALQARFAGSYPTSCGEREWPVAFPDPAWYAPRVVQAMWLGTGGKLSGQVRYGKRPDAAKLLLEAPSLPLSEIIKDINKFSNNVMAQQLYLSLSSELGAPGRFEASQLRLSQWWRNGFAGYPEPLMDNGSGLSRHERSTADALTALLQNAHAGPLGKAFIDSLSVAGVDGTSARWKDRHPQSPVIGNAWLKTGSLRDVASVAGYVQGQSGQRYTLVAVLNHPQAHTARMALDQLLEWTARDTTGAANSPMAQKKSLKTVKPTGLRATPSP